jgi:hypothetical protein
MSDVKRWMANWHMQEHFPNKDGECVLATDFDAASARIDELADLLKQAREHVPQEHPLRGLINANLMQHQIERGLEP